MEDKKLLETMMNNLPAVPNVRPTAPSNTSINSTVHSNNASPIHQATSPSTPPSTPSQVSKVKGNHTTIDIRERERVIDKTF